MQSRRLLVRHTVRGSVHMREAQRKDQRAMRRAVVTMLRCALAALVLLPACGGAPPSAADESSPDMVEPEQPAIAETEPVDEGCAMAFAPAPGLRDIVALAAQRWSRATGCNIDLSESGISVVTTPELVTEDGEAARGGTLMVDGECASIAIVASAWTHRTIAHEMGHCLGAAGHSETGLMATGSNETVIDA